MSTNPELIAATITEWLKISRRSPVVEKHGVSIGFPLYVTQKRGKSTRTSHSTSIYIRSHFVELSFEKLEACKNTQPLPFFKRLADLRQLALNHPNPNPNPNCRSSNEKLIFDRTTQIDPNCRSSNKKLFCTLIPHFVDSIAIYQYSIRPPHLLNTNHIIASTRFVTRLILVKVTMAIVQISPKKTTTTKVCQHIRVMSVSRRLC
jgi:hypothetical protein